MKKILWFIILAVAPILLANIARAATQNDKKAILYEADTLLDLPDLVVEDITINGSTSFTIVVKNSGTSSIPKGTTFSVKGSIYRHGNTNTVLNRTFTFECSQALASDETVSFQGSIASRTRPVSGVPTTQGEPEVDPGGFEGGDGGGDKKKPSKQKKLVATQGEPEDDMGDFHDTDIKISIKAQVDNDDRIEEGDETNNTLSRTFIVVQ